MRRREGSLPRRPPRCPRQWAGCALGLIARDRCAMRPSPSCPCSVLGAPTGPDAGVSRVRVRSPVEPVSCKPCTASAEHVGPWRKIRDQIHAEVCARGFSTNKKAFTQYYGSDALDASLLMMPLAGFLPFTDKRVRGTIEAIERELMRDGFVLRYRPEEEGVDGLPGGEGVFLPCSFWLASCLHRIGREKEARELFERLLH